VVGIVAAYALFVQSVLIGILGAGLAAHAADGNAAPGYELCLSHTTDTAQAPADSPAEHSNCTAHCLLGVAGSLKAALVPPELSLGRIGVAVSAIRWETRDWQIPRGLHNPVARQRGPPLAA
jgi:hypothetical protein